MLVYLLIPFFWSISPRTLEFINYAYLYLPPKKIKRVPTYKQQIILQTFKSSFAEVHRGNNLKLWKDTKVIDVFTGIDLKQ